MKYTITTMFCVEEGETKFVKIEPAIAILNQNVNTITSSKKFGESDFSVKICNYQIFGTKEEIIKKIKQNVCSVLAKASTLTDDEYKKEMNFLLSKFGETQNG